MKNPFRFGPKQPKPLQDALSVQPNEIENSPSSDTIKFYEEGEAPSSDINENVIQHIEIDLYEQNKAKLQ